MVDQNLKKMFAVRFLGFLLITFIEDEYFRLI
jgi:hypothetical protein